MCTNSINLPSVAMVIQMICRNQIYEKIFVLIIWNYNFTPMNDVLYLYLTVSIENLKLEQSALPKAWS